MKALNRHSGDRTAVSSIAVPGMDMPGQPMSSNHMTSNTPMEKFSTVSYGKTNITTLKTPRGMPKDGGAVGRADSRTTMRLSMKRKL